MGKQPDSFVEKLSLKALLKKRSEKSIVDYAMFRQDNFWYAVIAYKDNFVEHHKLMTLHLLNYKEFYKWVRIFKQIHGKRTIKYLSSGTMWETESHREYADYLVFKNDIYYCLKRDWTRKPDFKTVQEVHFKKLNPGEEPSPFFIEKTVIDWGKYWKEQEKHAKPIMEMFARERANERFKKMVPAKRKKGVRMYVQLYPVILRAYMSLCAEGARDSFDGNHLFADYAKRLVAKGEADPLMKKRPK